MCTYRIAQEGTVFDVACCHMLGGQPYRRRACFVQLAYQATERGRQSGLFPKILVNGSYEREKKFQRFSFDALRHRQL